MQTKGLSQHFSQNEQWLEEDLIKSLQAHLVKKIGHPLEYMNSVLSEKFALYTFFDEKTQTPLNAKLFFRQNEHFSQFYAAEKKLDSLEHTNITPLFFFEDQVGFPISFETMSPSLTVVEAPLFDTLNEVYLMNDSTSLIDEKLARTFFKQIVTALEYLHSREIYHTNLSLESIFVTDSFLLKLGEFHNCATSSQNCLSHHGTRDLRSPEVFEGQVMDLSKVDIYSLGIILFVLRYDMLPYTEEEPEDMIVSLYWKDREYFWSEDCLEVVDKGFRELFESMVAWDHDKRASLADVKASVWYNGETYTEEEVVAIMRKVI